MPLHLVRIQMDHLAAGKALFQFFHQSRFEFVFKHATTSKMKGIVRKTHSIPPIKGDVFIARVFVRKREFL